LNQLSPFKLHNPDDEDLCKLTAAATLREIASFPIKGFFESEGATWGSNCLNNFKGQSTKPDIHSELPLILLCANVSTLPAANSLTKKKSFRQAFSHWSRFELKVSKPSGCLHRELVRAV
ncbi:hypothetical protein M514_05065, partial [Trichuris suis]